MNNLLSVLMSVTNNGNDIVRAKFTTTTLVKLPKYVGLVNVTKTKTQILEVGGTYYGRINNRMEVRNLTGNVEKEGLRYGTWVAYPFLIEHNGSTMLRTYKVERCESEECIYKVDGHKASQEELEAIKSYLASLSHGSKKQSNVGLNHGAQVTPLNFKLENIDRIEFECGIVLNK